MQLNFNCTETKNEEFLREAMEIKQDIMTLLNVCQ